MAMARWQATIVDAAGNIVPNANVQVRRELPGLPLATLYADADGAESKSNAFTADASGYAFFHTTGGFYRIRVWLGSFERIWRFVAIGNAAAKDEDEFGIGATTDQKVTTPAGLAAYDDELEGFSVYVGDIGTGQAGITFKLSDDSGDWAPYGIITGPPGVGRGLDYDVDVADLTERAEYDDEPEGFRVLVSDSGDGRSAVYTKQSNDSADWGEPGYLTGDRFDLSFFVADNPYSGEKIGVHTFTHATVFPAGLTGSQGYATDPSSGTAVFTIQKNDVDIGSVTFDASRDATFALAGGASFAAGDRLTLIAPEPQDATLYEASITLAGSRAPVT